MKPGDLIEWAYVHSGETVLNEEIMWSSVDRCYVPVGREMSHMVISYCDEVLTWLNDRGVFQSYVGESGGLVRTRAPTRIFPRQILFFSLL
jgi:hypothetical protein